MSFRKFYPTLTVEHRVCLLFLKLPFFSLRKHPFLLGEERRETDVFAGYRFPTPPLYPSRSLESY